MFLILKSLVHHFLEAYLEMPTKLCVIADARSIPEWTRL